MKRPIIITIVAVLCCAAAAYLWVIAATLLIRPGTFSLLAGRQFMYGLELAGPWMMLLVGLGYALVGWGLFRLHNWARAIVILLMIISVAALVPRISMTASGASLLWSGLQIAVRAVLAWYFASAPVVVDAFTAKRTPRINTDLHG